MTVPHLLAFFLCLPGEAAAAGYYAFDSGIRALGRGQAFVAGVDDLSAQYWNPAALARLDGQVTAQLAAASQAVDFARASEPGAGTDGADLVFDPVRNEAPPFPIPAVGGAFRLGPRFVAAVGLTTPVAPSWSFPADGAQRYAVVDARVVQARVGPSLGWLATDRLELGLGIGWSLLQVDQTLGTSASFSPTDDPDYDARVGISVRDPFGLAADAGLRWAVPGDRVVLALAAVAPVRYRARGTMWADFSENVFYTGESSMGQVLAEPRAENPDALLEITMPPIVRGGLLLQVGEAAEVEADLVWEGWSVTGGLALQEAGLEVGTVGGDPLAVAPDIILPIVFRDAWSLRVGGEAPLAPRLRGRAGVFVETSAVPPEHQGVLVVDGFEAGYGLGATWAVGDRLAVDLALAQAFLPRHEVTGSQLYQLTIDPTPRPDPTPVSYGKPTGNGTFGATTTVAGLGLNWRW